MDISAVLSDKQLKTKAKVEAISTMLLEESISVADVMKLAKVSRDSEKGTCIEAIEFATRARSELASLDCLRFVTEALFERAPRVKWESAKVIGNIAHLYPGKLDRAVANLLTNSESNGTVVRWSAAFALSQIVKLRTKRNRDLVPAVAAIVRREKDNAIRKIYLAVLKEATASKTD